MHEFVRMDAPVKDGDEVALMPPFSGGSGLPAVRIQREHAINAFQVAPVCYGYPQIIDLPVE